MQPRLTLNSCLHLSSAGISKCSTPPSSVQLLFFFFFFPTLIFKEICSFTNIHRNGCYLGILLQLGLFDSIWQLFIFNRVLLYYTPSWLQISGLKLSFCFSFHSCWALAPHLHTCLVLLFSLFLGSYGSSPEVHTFYILFHCGRGSEFD